MLEADLLNSTSILRTIRASGSLESAQVAWGRALNLPGVAAKKKRREKARPKLNEGGFYSHQDLWGRHVAAAGSVKTGASDKEAAWSDWRIERIGRRFVA